MRVSKSEEYGLRLVMSLAVSGDQLTIRELAEREDLPDTTVAKIVGRLRRAGLVEAVRGRNGGYTLTRPADEISLGTVVSAFEAEVFSSDFCHTMSPGAGPCIKERRLRAQTGVAGSAIGHRQFSRRDHGCGHRRRRRPLPRWPAAGCGDPQQLNRSNPPFGVSGACDHVRTDQDHRGLRQP